jgi:hypothetical protein
METPEESDQLPEEGAEDYTPDDKGDGPSRDAAKESPGGADEGDSDPDQATGNPANAG